MNTHFKTSVNQERGPIIDFAPCPSVEEWIQSQNVAQGEWKQKFEKDGYLVIENLIDEENAKIYANLYSKFLSGEIDARAHRHDLGSNEPQKLTSDENICQIMWPSDYVRIAHGPLHQRTRAVSRLLLGNDIEFDFDMLIYKAPFTNTDTPWHQDEGYWPDMPDKRAVSCWVALDKVTVDNGCMWFIPGAHKKPVHTHVPASEGSHVLKATEVDSSCGVPVPLSPGGCTFHGGRMLHFTRGNTTATQRRAFITNYRPGTMVEWERTNGFSHGRDGLDGITNSEILSSFKDTKTNLKQN